MELTRGRIGVMAELRSAHFFRRHDVIGRTAALLGNDDVLLSFGRRTLQEARRRMPSQYWFVAINVSPRVTIGPFGNAHAAPGTTGAISGW